MEPEPVVLLVDDRRPEGRTTVVESLRRRRLVGHVPSLVAGDSVTAVLPLSGDRLLVLVDVEEGPVPGPTPEEVALQLSSELGSSVGFADASGEPIGFVEVGAAPGTVAGPAISSEVPPQPVGRALFVVAGDLPLREGRDAELALALGGMWVASYGTSHADSGPDVLPGVLVIPDALADVTVWTASQRPVVLLSAVPGRLAVQAYLREDLRRAARRDRLAQRGLPGREWFVDVEPTRLLEPDRLAGLPEAERERVDHWQSAGFAPRPDVDDLAVELGLDQARRSALETALAAPLSARTAHDLLTAIGVPARFVPGAASVLDGADPGEVPDAVRVERRGLAGTVWRGLTEEATGSSWTAAWRRLPHRYPWAAALLLAVNLAIGAGLLWWSATDRDLLAGSVWTVVLAVLGLVWLTEGVLEAALLRHARRHRGGPERSEAPASSA